jgi:hypothetical protein
MALDIQLETTGRVDVKAFTALAAARTAMAEISKIRQFKVPIGSLMKNCMGSVGILTGLCCFVSCYRVQNDVMLRIWV